MRTWLFETFFTVNFLQVYGKQQKLQQMKYIISTPSRKNIRKSGMKIPIADFGGSGNSV